MRDSRDLWSFYELKDKPPLSRADVAYWKSLMTKITKVGIEFEFNLPEKQNGSCKGNSTTCPCKNLTEDADCWKQCVFSKNCEIIARKVKNCLNATATCEDSDCKNCEHFDALCEGIYCPSFVGMCCVCEEFDTSCKTCEFLFDPSKSPDHIRQSLTQELQPNRSYGVVSSSGVHNIVKDGSLLGQKGAEIVTTGRRVDYWEFYEMTKNIIRRATAKGAYGNERCSMHMHMLASYYGSTAEMGGDGSIPNKINEMERDMPQTIMANFHQLIRRYQNAMTWMTTGLDEAERLTRWEKFRVSVLEVEPLRKSMREVQSEVAQRADGKKYGWVNYNSSKFTRNGDVSRFHVEMRAADLLLSPSAVSAIACMYYALLIKAIEISRYGVVGVGSKEWVAKAAVIKEALLNNRKDYQDGDRFSDTRELYKYHDVLVAESMDLVRQLKAILHRIGPAFEVLEKLAMKPCALRRIDGDSWEKIEEDLSVVMTEEDSLAVKLEGIIKLNQVTECKNIAEWIEAVEITLRERGEDDTDESTKAKITEYVEDRQNDGMLIWSGPIGAPMLT
jgi:hypothetical protein